MSARDNCFNCVYSHWDRNQALWGFTVGRPARPTCGNQPDFPGRMRTCPTGPVCRNFRLRPPTPQGETVKAIPLGDGFYAYVDAADYDCVSQWNWCLHNGYAARRDRGKTIYLHRAILPAPKGMVVDHLNHNRLDDTRANLEVCTQGENLRNTQKRRGTASRFRGLYFCKRTGTWCPRIRFEGKYIYLGSFAEEIAAARAYDYKAVELLGEKAPVNFPEEWPPERRREVHARWLATEGENKKEEGKKRKGKKKVKARRPKADRSRAKAKPARRTVKGDKKNARGAERKAKKRQ